MPNKPRKYGIKIWALCDAEIFYSCNLSDYLGNVGKFTENNL
jgi:hypothetical protein